MKQAVIITGTEVKGCTYHMKEAFLQGLGGAFEVTEFTLPRDMPHFCVGCKLCFFESESRCPHSDSVMPIWNAMLGADLIVFAAPVYVMRVPGQVKALLDHFGCHWMVHRPDPAMFTKRAVILTQSVGAPNAAAQKDIVTSLSWMGVPSIKRFGFGLMEGVIWDELSGRLKSRIIRKTKRFAKGFRSIKPARKSLKVRVLFFISKQMHKGVLKKETTPGADNRHWIEQGWLKGKDNSV
ncbi:MAG: NAD(P)H-dependent oxidoreductase [Oscillospiraceae bacterium]|jgi:multimeric flavodoxin WrbA|nr:NAD(P)H-dependent oxidoreductase [Oscillospiraceae bacterium]